MFPADVFTNQMQVILSSILLELLLMLNNTSDDITKFCLEYTVNC